MWQALERGEPCCSDIDEWMSEAGCPLPTISSRLLAVAVSHNREQHIRTLYNHLRLRFGLPTWVYAACYPELVARRISQWDSRLHQPQYLAALPTNSARPYTIHLPADGAEFCLHFDRGILLGGIVCFDYDYRTAARLLHGLPTDLLNEASYWFAKDAAALDLTRLEYAGMIATPEMKLR